jgi:hypothetical protein
MDEPEPIMVLVLLNMEPQVGGEIGDARLARAHHAGMLSEGSVNPEDLAAYKHWITVSLMLGDVTRDEAEASIERAENVFEANCDHFPVPHKPKDPPPT